MFTPKIKDWKEITYTDGSEKKRRAPCWSAQTSEAAASTARHPQAHAEPLFQAIPWPPAPGTPCRSKRHQISFYLLPHWSLHA
eukprot:92665-Pelagomonas_calceolata.AAC.1